MVVLSLYKKPQIGYTQYVDNDVYVDDVDADEAGAGATVDQWMDHWQRAVSRTSLRLQPNVTRVSVDDNAFY